MTQALCETADGKGRAEGFLRWAADAVERLKGEAADSDLQCLFTESEWQVPPPDLVALLESLQEAIAARRLCAEPICRTPGQQEELERAAHLACRSVETVLARLTGGGGSGGA